MGLSLPVLKGDLRNRVLMLPHLDILGICTVSPLWISQGQLGFLPLSMRLREGDIKVPQGAKMGGLT